MIKKFLLCISACLLLQACSKVDDYMLGKDNTPKPEKLKPVKSKAKIAQDWSIPVSKPLKASAFLKIKPVIQNDVIYIADPGGQVHAIDQKTTKSRWSKQIKGKIISGPSVNDDVIAIGTDEATVVLLDKKNGDVKWTASVSSDALSRPVITKNKVIVKTIDGHLYGLNLANGQKEWVVDHGAPSLILKASSSPVVHGNLALVGFSDGKLDAVDLETGSVKWQRGIAYANGASDVERLVDIDADPIIRGDTAYLATYQGYVGAFSLSNGQFIWRKPVSTYKNIAIDSQALYLTDSDDVIWAFDLKNGHVRWKQLALKARQLTEPVIFANRILLGDKHGFLHVLSSQNGEFLSRKQLGDAIYYAPTVSGKKVYVMTGNGKLNQLAVS